MFDSEYVFLLDESESCSFFAHNMSREQEYCNQGSKSGPIERLKGTNLLRVLPQKLLLYRARDTEMLREILFRILIRESLLYPHEIQ